MSKIDYTKNYYCKNCRTGRYLNTRGCCWVCGLKLIKDRKWKYL